MWWKWLKCVDFGGCGDVGEVWGAGWVGGVETECVSPSQSQPEGAKVFCDPV